MTRIAVARLWHEGNSFTPVATTLEHFRSREWCEGAQAAEFYAGTRTEIGAAVEFFKQRSDFTPVFLRCAAAPPGGAVAERDLQQIIGEIAEGVRGANADALYLSLHGALIGSKTLRADVALVEAARRALGKKPVALSFDLHANLDPAIARLADIIVGYKTYPHIDMYETGRNALQLLTRFLEMEIHPVVAVAKAGVVLPSFKMRTAVEPMASIEALASERTIGNVLDVTPFGGFAYGDSPCAGASVAVTADDDPRAAEAVAVELAREMYRRRREFSVALPGPEEAFKALGKTNKPAAILEPADNPLSGGVGDTTGLLQSALNYQGRAVFAFFWDPGLASRCQPGMKAKVELGGRLSAAWGRPVPLDVEVERVTDGRFRNAGPMERGLEVNLGRTAVLRAGGLRIIVTSSCQSPNDMEYFRLHGIDLAQTDLVCAKAKNHFRAAFGEVFDPILEVDTAGPAAADLTKLPFKNVSIELRA